MRHGSLTRRQAKGKPRSLSTPQHVRNPIVFCFSRFQSSKNIQLQADGDGGMRGPLWHRFTRDRRRRWACEHCNIHPSRFTTGRCSRACDPAGTRIQGQRTGLRQRVAESILRQKNACGHWLHTDVPAVVPLLWPVRRSEAYRRQGKNEQNEQQKLGAWVKRVQQFFGWEFF